MKLANLPSYYSVQYNHFVPTLRLTGLGSGGC